MEQPFGAVERLDREVGTRGVPDEEGIAGEHEPRLIGARAVDQGEGAVLRAVPGRVDRADDDVAELDLRAVVQRLVLEGSACGLVDVDGQAVLEGEAPVAGDVIGVRMRLENADQVDRPQLALLEVLLDRERGIDHDRDALVLVADEIRRTPEIVVDELREEHVSDASTGRGYFT